ncbi:MAG: SprT-like domain-containing protein [Pseudomonadota bacterium]
MAQTAISTYEKTPEFRPTINIQFHATLEFLFHQINDRLFEPYLADKAGKKLGRAPACILCAEYKRTRYLGFAARAAWSERHGRRLDQITIVFDHGEDHDVRAIAQTLAHEMVHATEFRDGTIGRNNYHGAGFRDRMRSIGLQTSKTGKPGGAELGTGMSDYVIEGGPFEKVIEQIIAEGFAFPVAVAEPKPLAGGMEGGGEPPVKPKDPSKAKFFCPSCGQIARAKKTARLKCGRPSCQNRCMELDWG